MKKLLMLLFVLCMVLIIFCSWSFNKQKAVASGSDRVFKEETRRTIPKIKEKVLVTLYFGDAESGNLITEKKPVEKDRVIKDAPKTIIEELAKGPTNKKLIKVIPEGTKILGVTKEKNLVTVDFSQEFVSNHSGGSMGETITIYGIVNSLTEIKDVENVQFLIEGEKQGEYKGHYQFDIPFERDEGLIVK